MGKSLVFILYILCLIFSGCEKDGMLHNYPYKVIGETIILTDQQWNELWKYNMANLTLYKIEPNGRKIIYRQDVDYVLQENRIKRTLNSRIPNFENHKVVYNCDGKFEWSPEPDRNPELTLPYQIYADYNYMDTSSYIQISPRLSNKLRDKIVQRRPLKIATIGTSISFGSHTFENYYHNNDSQTYHQLVSKALFTNYGLACNSINWSTDGGGVNQIQDLTKILVEKPDIVFLELGMNDHIGVNPDIDYYKHSLE